MHRGSQGGAEAHFLLQVNADTLLNSLPYKRRILFLLQLLLELSQTGLLTTEMLVTLLTTLKTFFAMKQEHLLLAQTPGLDKSFTVTK